ncbi:MAG: aldo/keto reductase [Spirochaetaceae bacterium]|nr:MAG: aldo/keto reductase [Spirochaetaceae bacterium]
MQYRKFGRLDWEVSILGFGAMRLPVKGEAKNIDEKQATRMLHYAIEHGVNYVDTAYTYHDGESERFLGRALGRGRRDRIKLATKMPSWLVNDPADLDRLFHEQLKRLKSEHIDFYLLHNLNRDHWAKTKEFGGIQWGQRAVEAGKIGQLGFSFHDDFELFKEIVDAWDWPFCQIQYNYMDVRNQAGARGLKYAAAKGMAVIVMEPILGGRLVNPAPPIQKIWDRARRQRSAADWALRWVWNQAEVSLVLSGMSTYQQVVENIESAESAGIGVLDQQEQQLIREVRRRYKKLAPIPCTRCGYCMPCPHGVDIPHNLNLYNEGLMYGRPDLARRQYGFIKEKARSASCTQCRECEPKCPQSILISEWMPKITGVLAEGSPYPR